MNINNVDKIFNELAPDKVEPVHHIGSHARLLAGPGTGKTFTLTHRVLYLILKQNVEPENILLLTFTRLASRQLKEELEKVLKSHEKSVPTVSTLHSFALRQILLNYRIVDTLPTPVRIADDWEERHIILEDLKIMMGVKEIGEIKDLFNQLSADWENLNADENGWEKSFIAPQFISAFTEHKTQYGETLRSELVYQLKKCLTQNGSFRLDKEYKHVLIDEYQDLNPCDLAIVKEFADRDSELFVVGDDDQSIYGFRHANPRGIRDFPQHYDEVKRLALETCYRCDKKIFATADFVANLDRARLPKPTKPLGDAKDGDVMLLNFPNQYIEARYIAKKIKSLIDDGLSPEKIVVLFRGSKDKLIKPFIDEFNTSGIPFKETVESEIADSKEYRIVLSFLRLVGDLNDNLAFRTLLQLESNKLGEKCINDIHAICKKGGISFIKALHEIKETPLLIKQGMTLNEYVSTIVDKVTEYKSIAKIANLVNKVVADNMSDNPLRDKVLAFLGKSISNDEQKIGEFLRLISSDSDKMEQDTEGDGVSLLTMHQAKGLTFDTCFIVALEDEFLPGKNADVNLDDERRLLYVSMTRPKHRLYLSYCSKRIDIQKHTGRNSGDENRQLTRFLKDIPFIQTQIIKE